MQSFSTKYGNLNNVTRYSLHENGQLDSLCLDSEHKLNTSIGILIPRFQDFTGRRKNTKCLLFYPSGTIKSIDLQEPTAIPTPIGVIEAELVTFYENGSLKRIFPLNGAVNGMWLETDEAELMKRITFNMLNRSFHLKVNSIFFYPDGKVKSVSFFPGETASVPTPFGIIETRIGFSFLSDGRLRSLEPESPYAIETPIGLLHAYDSSAMEIHADQNSLIFDSTGNKVAELVTSTDIIKITDQAGKIHYLAPSYVESSTSIEETELVPLNVKFDSETITFSCLDAFTIKISDIASIKLSSIPLISNECTDCATCGKCK
ncbi:toxin-antitoxin system YwqK family antitoxin [[Clostridium] fimetarium]|uniref:Uncharacterized protein n=1 Tax=[Clostridium] fimetarium TaxID=99656 RepID=A0A1I0PNS5_9FIRM|nr:hypothetical protein [[Clostridium] fimetarium]SEW15993.1 hypothetical protein SAMN05421659_105220 [[Clostridium] fimetarium]